jgi:excinuclease ABC subunit A
MSQSHDSIVIRGARQNNLKNLTLALPANELIVVTGVSGSGKSSLVFDTLYAEGQRRYVETFSPYARQFLDRMDKPLVDAIEGIPPAIAIDQVNPVRTSRSTVGTMTELNDHLKLLFARAARLYCRGCGAPVRRDTPQTIYAELVRRAGAADDPRLVITFPIAIPKNFSTTEVKQLLERQGYARFHSDGAQHLEVVQDRLRFSSAERSRIIEALEAALKHGQGRVNAHVPSESTSDTGAGQGGVGWKFSTALHCPDCDIDYQEPTPSLFSFNSPVGACTTCRGFGRVIGIDYGLVVPDVGKTLREGAVRPWQTEAYGECQDDLIEYAKKRRVPLDVAWRDLAPDQRHWVLEGESAWVSWRKSWPGTWYGVKRFFDWLETKAYRMHIRVLLSRYRAYTPCAACGGARLKTEALSWRVGSRSDAEAVVSPPARFLPRGVAYDRGVLEALPGLTLHDLALLPIARCAEFFQRIALGALKAGEAGSADAGSPNRVGDMRLDQATELLLENIQTRLSYLVEVGLGYLTLDRQSRTLSGGEVQRINLTTALGTSLTGTLFVLDEPSIGLHPRDMGRVIGVMRKLRDAGNSLVVVEHEPQIMFAADRILDLGPGPGERGGNVVFFGAPQALRAATTSLTGDYLTGRRRARLDGSRPPARNGAWLEVKGAAEHNLKSIDIEFPLERLVCITGVSGSGKSTLVEDVLYRALLKARGRPTEAPGAHRALYGHRRVGEVVMVNQSPIGRTTRSNPASYVGAFDAIRKVFAAQPLARERGYTPGTFSFNSGTGRCPACGGNGFERVEMQFLSDVYLRCPDCDGRRFRAEVLEVACANRSIADALDMTVSEALAFFSDHHEVRRALKPLADVGLEYLRLGQPVPTLSGGEAQRLKLAGHLAAAADRPSAAGSSRRGSLFLFDEPTTGLHFDDVAKLLGAFRKLLAAGHSLIVIEHNLDVIAAADWIIDLGPEGGEAGGEIVCAGTPQQVAACLESHTGKALRDYEAAIGSAASDGGRGSAMGEPRGVPIEPSLVTVDESRRHPDGAIRVHNAREHNLKSIDVEIPRGQFTVITGVSGSGKSTLAFDIVFAEGQRRYLESLNAYARQFVEPAARPDVDAIFGIPPTVAIEQRVSRGGRKSTVGTLTEIHHFLRLLFVKLGLQHCPSCAVPIEPQTSDAIAARILRENRGQRVGLLAPLVVNRKGYYTDLAKWARGKGYTHLRVDGEFLPTAGWPRLDRFREHTIELPVADVRATAGTEGALRTGLKRALEYGKGVVHVLSPLDALERAMATHDAALAVMKQTVFSAKRACPACGISFPELDPRLFSYNSRHGWCTRCYGTGVKLAGFDAEQTGEEIWWNEWYEGAAEPCPACDGKRLNPTALAVRFRGRSIADLASLPVAHVERFFVELPLAGREAEIARDLVAELRSRFAFLREVGLAYLALDRAAPTLSGGEAQRIRLAAQLGSNLRGVCYILDEPTIGLHPRDNRVLLDALGRLEAKGNTLVVVEHDEETIRRARHVIDLGPGAGSRGGHVVAAGSAAELMRVPASVTGRFLAAPLAHPLHAHRPVGSTTPVLVVEGTGLHNLKHLDVAIPLGRLVVVTGVSGSGKSTLARDVLYTNLHRLIAARRPPRRKDEGGRRKAAEKPAEGAVSSSFLLPPSSFTHVGCRALRGAEQVARVLEVDQTPIGKTPRSCPATYVGFWDQVRRLYAEVSEARVRGYTPSRFSFNTAGGRCEVCEGQGLRRIEMSFLPDVKVMCEACRGARFNPETLGVRFKDRTIGDVLAMNVDEAVDFFAAHASIHRCLRLLQDVGLGYLTLGQQSPTLSGGEAQRIKLVTELAKVRSSPSPDARNGHTLYVLDEPTVGLHMADVEKLIRVLHRLVDAGNTVIVVEHNLDVIAEADWVIDLGPEGGAVGGCIVAQGPPENISQASSSSHTARILAEFLRSRGNISSDQAAASRC